MKYEASGWISFSEEDTIDHGCLPQTGTTDFGRDHFSDDTIEGLLKQLMDFVDARPPDMQLDSCDEEGRVDIQVMQREDGSPANGAAVQRWHDNEERLWLVCFTFRVSRVEREVVKLT